MKKIILAIIGVLVAMSTSAQTLEPEYIGQVVVVNADSTTTLLQKEAANIKVKSTKFGRIPLPGTGLLDKSRSMLVVSGAKSPVTVKPGRLTLIIRAEKNTVDPKNVFGVFKFEVKKKERQYIIAESSFVGGTKSTMNMNTVPTVVKKYGTDSYLVVIENVLPGQYGISSSDISSVATFAVE